MDLNIGGSDGIVARIEADLERLGEFRDETARAARGAIGSQSGHTLNARARKLSMGITSIEQGLYALKDAIGMVASPRDHKPSPGQPVHGAFEVVVRRANAIVTSNAGGVSMTVWPEKPISAVINEALVLLEATQESGTFGLRLVGMGPVNAYTVNDAGIHSGDVLELYRPAGDPA